MTSETFTSERAFPERWYQTIPMGNTVRRLNPSYTALFPTLTEGTQADIPLYVPPHDYLGKERNGLVGAITHHRRNAHFLRIISDTLHRTCFSTKGSIWFKYQPKQWAAPLDRLLGGRINGLADRRHCEYDWEWAEKCKTLGVHVVEPVAIIEFTELLKPLRHAARINGELRNYVRTPVEELKEALTPHATEQEPSPEPIVPCAYIRAHVWATRIEDMVAENEYVNDNNSLRDELSEAMRAIETFYGLPKPLDPKTYCEWVSAEIGRNFGLLQANRIMHGYTHYGNFTLAGELTDLDSLRKDTDGSLKGSLKEDIIGNGKRTKWMGSLLQAKKLIQKVQELFPEKVIDARLCEKLFWTSYHHFYERKDSAKDVRTHEVLDGFRAKPLNGKSSHFTQLVS